MAKRQIRCKVPNCDRILNGKAGYATHLRWHVKKGHITKAQYSQLTTDDPEETVVIPEKELRRLRANIRRANRRVSFYAKKTDFIDRVCRVMSDSMEALPAVEPPHIEVPDKAKNDETVVLLLSDVHVGKKTPTYNHEVFKERMGKLMESVQSIVSVQRNARPLKNIEVVLGGDIIDAESIYPGQAVDGVSAHILDQIYTHGIPEFVRLFEFLMGTFKSVSVHAVAGNHGNLNASKWTSAKSTNWDLVFYHSLKTALRGQERLTWDIADDDFKAMWKIYDWGMFATHGDMIRMYYNVPNYGLTRQSTRWQATYRDEMELNYFLFGHFHTLMLHERFNQIVFTVNGSWVTDDEFAEEKMGIGSEAEQAIFGVHPEQGRTWSYPLYIE